MATKIKIIREIRQVQSYLEDKDRLSLRMIEIPTGEFLMGAPKEEADSGESERPQHWVKVNRFLMSNTPITQAQWAIVAGWEKVAKELDPDPSHFKGAKRPVEKVSWQDALEFCARLAQKTEKPYRLPTEAEWEYACRARRDPPQSSLGLYPPFHFGETLSTQLANYRGTDNESMGWSGSYGRGEKGEYREETTEVGIFPANEWGLHDMHGNVWEWCLDPWHENYEGAPTDGSAWDNENRNHYHLLNRYSLNVLLKTESRRVVRGGSWYFYPRNCRSANRYRFYPDSRFDDIGFRIACGFAGT